MNALTPTKLMRVVEPFQSILGDVVLSRDIIVNLERISNYCLTKHEAVYEDLATLVESMAYCDRLVPRRPSSGWSRNLSIVLPAYEYAHFQQSAMVDALSDAAWFLTGDKWKFEFVARQGPLLRRQGRLDIPQTAIKDIIPFSDGLDSFAQAQLSIHEHGRDAVMLVRSGLTREQLFPQTLSVRIPRKFSGVRLRESS